MLLPAKLTVEPDEALMVSVVAFAVVFKVAPFISCQASVVFPSLTVCVWPFKLPAHVAGALQYKASATAHVIGDLIKVGFTKKTSM